jgi:glycerol-3-phosphate dehydrogenase (NAD(P)+)
LSDKVTVLVAGSWGTALAKVLAENGHETRLWTRNENQAEEINVRRTNSKYLPDVSLPAGLTATTDLEAAISGSSAVIIAATSSSMREVVKRAAPYLKENMLVVHATKGFERTTLKRMSQVIAEELPHMDAKRICVLSGPSHAEEVSKRCPTTVVVASHDTQAAETAQDLFINSYFRVYTNPDLVGVEISGALKNIIAIGAGMSDGLGFGDNAKAALLTRGLVEITRLGKALNANPMTFAGLSGVGDLIVTCTSRHSRNWRAGYQIAQGKRLEEVLEEMGMVVEGVQTTRAAYQLAREYNVSMPITNELYEVLFNGKNPRVAVEDLMGRGRTHEIEEIARTGSMKWLT